MSNLSFIQQVGDGTTKQFTLAASGENIGYFRTEDIHVYVDDVEVTFTINTASPHLVTLTAAPASGSAILIRREMPVDAPYANFERGNYFGPKQVNNSFLQQLYTTQEILDGFVPEGHYFKQDIDAGNHKVVNVSDAESPLDAVNLRKMNSAFDEFALTIAQPAMLGDGIWSHEKRFTAYNQYMIYNGEAYSPLYATILPYIVGTVPDLGFVYQIKLNSLQALSGLSSPSDLAQRHRIKTTVAEIATGVFSDGDLLEVTDRDGAPFEVSPGASSNFIDILDAGTGRIATLQNAKKQPISAFGGYPSTPNISTILDRMVAAKSEVGVIDLEDGGYIGTLATQALYGMGLRGLGEGATKLVPELSSGDGVKVVTGKQFRSVEIKDIGFTQSTYATGTQGTGIGINLSGAITSVDYRIQNVSLNYFGTGFKSSVNAFSNQMDNVRANFCTVSFDFSGTGQLINHVLNNCYSSQPKGVGLYMAGCKSFVLNAYNSGSAGFPHVNIAGGSSGIIFNAPNFEQDTGTLGSNTEAIRCQSDSEVAFNYPTFALPKSVDSTTYLFRVMNTAVVYINSPKIVGADANIKHIYIQDTATVYLNDPKGAIDRSKVTIVGSGRLIDVNSSSLYGAKASGKVASHAAGASISTGLTSAPTFWDVKIDLPTLGDTVLDVQAQVTQVGTGTLKVRFISASSGTQVFGSYPLIWEVR